MSKTVAKAHDGPMASRARERTLMVAALLALGITNTQAGGYHHHHYPHRWGYSPSVSFYYSPAPLYYPSYGYGYNYGYRPNYAVGGTLLGALTGGLIGHSIGHQGWEGAGIGAAAGLLLGGLAEHHARAQEQRAYSGPPVSYAQPNYSAPQENVATIPDAPTAPLAPTAPAAPTIPDRPTAGSAINRPMAGANQLFGR